MKEIPLSENKKIRIKHILILSVFLLFACSAGETWEGYVYPDRNNLQINHNAGKFSSLEECRDASLTMLKSMEALEKGYAECGKNCKSGSEYYNRTCEETARINFYH
jgi:hypothetical protein